MALLDQGANVLNAPVAAPQLKAMLGKAATVAANVEARTANSALIHSSNPSALIHTSSAPIHTPSPHSQVGGGSSALELLLARAAAGAPKGIDDACASLLSLMVKQASCVLPPAELEGVLQVRAPARARIRSHLISFDLI